MRSVEVGAALTGEDAVEEETLTGAREATGRRSPVPWAGCVSMCCPGTVHEIAGATMAVVGAEVEVAVGAVGGAV